jgi:hypothetical protein
MIPTHILLLLCIFVVMYFVGTGLTLVLLISAFKDKERFTISWALILLILEISFGLSLI